MLGCWGLTLPVLGCRIGRDTLRDSPLSVDDDRDGRAHAGDGVACGLIARGADRLMAAPPVLGDLEQLVLLAVMRLGETAYAVSLRAEIAERARRDVSRRAIQVTLDRLERKGLLRSHLGDPTAERGGKAKRMFALTGAGSNLILGCMTLPAHLSLARWHIAGAISLMLFSVYSPLAGATGVAVLLAATCLADRARPQGEDATDETRPANS